MKFTHPGQNSESIHFWMRVFSGLIPNSAVAHVSGLMSQHAVEFHLSRPRVSKLGHYRSAHKGKPHHISVNENLIPERFLLTLVHEIAHLKTYVNHGRKVKPHGVEWKFEFQEAMLPLLNEEVFSTEILPLIQEHLYSPKATSCSDPRLHKAFERMGGKNTITLDEIPDGSTFKIRTGRIFIKGEKNRTRYLCTEVPSRKKYLVHGSAEITGMTMAKSL